MWSDSGPPSYLRRSEPNIAGRAASASVARRASRSPPRARPCAESLPLGRALSAPGPPSSAQLVWRQGALGDDAPADRYEPAFVSEDNGLRSVPRWSLRRILLTWVRTVASPRTSSAAISALDRPRATSLSTSSSRLVSSSSLGGRVVPGAGRRTNSLIMRWTIAGASCASPAAVACMASTSRCGPSVARDQYWRRDPTPKRLQIG